MKCLNCGCASEHFLCKQCETIETLEKLFSEIRFYKPDACTNPHLRAYFSGLSEKNSAAVIDAAAERSPNKNKSFEKNRHRIVGLSFLLFLPAE